MAVLRVPVCKRKESEVRKPNNPCQGGDLRLAAGVRFESPVGLLREVVEVIEDFWVEILGDELPGCVSQVSQQGLDFNGRRFWRDAWKSMAPRSLSRTCTTYWSRRTSSLLANSAREGGA